MAVRRKTYQSKGGMNRRKAGEDFYFLHKLMPLGHFGELTTTTVYPSPRVSNRVPFGTGKAMGDWLEKNQSNYETYDPVIFYELKFLIDQLEAFYNAAQVSKILLKLPKGVQHYLEEQDFISALEEMRQNSASKEAFKKRCFRWLNGFRVLKYVHLSRDHYHPNVELQSAVIGLLDAMQIKIKRYEPRDLLHIYSQLDRQERCIPED